MSGILTLYLALASLAAVLDKATAETLPSQVVVGTGDIIGFGETEASTAACFYLRTG